MSILKLANAGDEATLDIAACSYVEGEYGPQVRFDTKDDVTLYLPQTSADRQLDRIGLLDGKEEPENAYTRVPGNTLVFSRTASNRLGGKPFWNINTVKTNGKPPVAKNKVPVPAHSNVPEKDLPEFLQNQQSEDNAALAAKVGVDLTKFSKDLALYTALTEFVARDIAPIYAKAGIGMSPESAAAATATLYIQAHK